MIRSSRLGVRAAALCASLMVLVPAAAWAQDDFEARLERLAAGRAELATQIAALDEAVSGFMPFDPAAAQEPRENGARPERIEIAQSSREAAALNLRISQMEEQMRVLTGQVEGLQFQMTQMQTFLERMQQDYEFRFEQLEGAPGKTSAAPQSGGAMPSGGVPQSSAVVGTVPTDLQTPGGSNVVIDPQAEGFEIGSAERPLGTLDSRDLSLSGQPLDLNSGGGGGSLVTDADANAQYQAGYDAVVRGDYAFAEDQFRQFIGLFPDHPQAPEATNWLGEALLQRGEYDEAADILLTGFQSYPNSPRAPDILLKLGMALAGAGETETACRTYGEVLRRYPNQPASFTQRLNSELSAARC